MTYLIRHQFPLNLISLFIALDVISDGEARPFEHEIFSITMAAMTGGDHSFIETKETTWYVKSNGERSQMPVSVGGCWRLTGSVPAAYGGGILRYCGGRWIFMTAGYYNENRSRRYVVTCWLVKKLEEELCWRRRPSKVACRKTAEGVENGMVILWRNVFCCRRTAWLSGTGGKPIKCSLAKTWWPSYLANCRYHIDFVEEAFVIAFCWSVRQSEET